ncbi:MAG: hypothetical protein K2P81_00040 [Bacteriovoracaceae bacterium]|nr:hypothetical protein [Bacteriovoracaceae bacterium]
MSQILFFALWVSAFSSLLATQHFIHQKHVEAMKDDITRFETEWKKLESINAKV